MKLSRKTVGVLIGLTIAALSGLLALQYRFLMRSLDLRDETFRRNVNAALNMTAARLEESDLRNRVFFADSDSHPYAVKFIKREDSKIAKRRDTTMTVMVSSFGSGSTTVEGNRLSYMLGAPQRVSIKVFDTFGRLDTVILDGMRGEGRHELQLPRARLSRGVFFLQVRMDSASSTYRWEGQEGVTSFESDFGRPGNENIIRRIAETVTASKSRPLAERVNREIVDSLLAQSFGLNGIPIGYGFEVRDMISDSVLVVRIAGTGEDSVIVARFTEGSETRETSFKIPIFTHDFSGTPGELTVWFPDYRSHLMSEFLPELGLNVFFVAIVLACFWYTIRTILRQREFAEGVTDFINNMTHEFKTPLSTISLASEALAKPEVARVRKRIDRYNKIIAEENARMRTQVEKILHMAALEEGEYIFRRDPVDIHGIIRKAVKAVTLQVS
ncbi:MAG: histidine kinase dimerization/phospho-acceptor domain-containing protein, partial [Bacteroidota bacterium]